MNGVLILSNCHIPATLWAQQNAPKKSSLLEKFQCRIVFFEEVHEEHFGGHAISSHGLRPNDAATNLPFPFNSS
jgi:hypothetical protein